MGIFCQQEEEDMTKNQRSLHRPGGGMFTSNTLTPMEQEIYRNYCLSSAAKPKGPTFGEQTSEDEIIFLIIVSKKLKHRPVVKKGIVVVTSNRLKRPHEHVTPTHLHIKLALSQKIRQILPEPLLMPQRKLQHE
ncbi:uncharacterized protein LOC142234930 [Haematobia irritans]|uniref:uncharacterized protein LOC142234930 n=1 Tax=Haematobia irritans TaxID=7368 RepID=UPI003F4F6E83